MSEGSRESVSDTLVREKLSSKNIGEFVKTQCKGKLSYEFSLLNFSYVLYPGKGILHKKNKLFASQQQSTIEKKINNLMLLVTNKNSNAKYKKLLV